MRSDARDQVRVLRILEYVGERHWVESTVNKSIQGVKFVGSTGQIRAVTVGNYPECLREFDSALLIKHEDEDRYIGPRGVHEDWAADPTTCEHEFRKWFDKNGTLHVTVCPKCGYTEEAATRIKAARGDTT